MIPESKQAAVTRALHESFGVSEVEDIRGLTGGLTTAPVFRIVVQGEPYLLKIIMNTVGARVPGGGDPTHQFACVKLGAEAGIAPQIRYANAEDGILITEFIDAKPFPDDMAPWIAPVLRTLHGLPQFPKSGYPTGAVVAGFIRRFEDAHILSESETGELLRGYARMTAVYPQNEDDLVACHNDLKPQNMLFDGRRVLLVDWEAAFLNDRYIDLAVVANFFVDGDAEVDRYLDAYFGEPASDYRRARFYLARQANHMFYAVFFLLLAAKAGLQVDGSQEVPEFRAFHRGLISGEIDVANAEAKLQYGRIHLREFAQNMRTPRFEEALATVAAEGQRV